MIKTKYFARSYYFILFMLWIALAGCTGEPGPAGPPGKDGNANVTVFDFDVKDSSWRQNSDRTIHFDTAISQITREILLNGAVQVYEVGFDSVSLILLPSIYTLSNGHTVVENVAMSPGWLYVSVHSDTTLSSIWKQTVRYRVVIIEGESEK